MGRSLLVSLLGLLALALGSVAHANTTPNDPGFPQQWALANNGQEVRGQSGSPDADVDAEEAWDLTTGSNEVVLALVDSGIDYEHFDLAGNIWTNSGETGDGKESNGLDDDGNGYVDDWRGWDVIDGDGVARDKRGHGTHVAGIAAATGNDGFGIAGVAWSTKIMSIRIGTTAPTVDRDNFVQGIRYAVANGARVVNLSIGKPENWSALEDVISQAPETLFVAASGNGGADEVGDNVDEAGLYPCSLEAPNVVCVASTNSRDELSPSSNYGPRSVDLAAPGQDVITTSPGQVFYDDVDDDDTDWTRGGTNSTWARVMSGSNGVLSDSPRGSYAPGTDSYIRLDDPISFRDEEQCRLSYLAHFQADSAADQLITEVSPDSQTWTAVRTMAGSSGAARFYEDDISFLDGDDSVYIRFRLVTDPQGAADGVRIDQVLADCERGPQDIHDFVYASGTSFAAPHVSGAAALLFAMRPDATVEQVKDALLQGVDRISSLEGKVATGGRLNLRSSLEFFRDTTPPAVTDVQARPRPFTPNGDGRGDRLRIRFTVSEPAVATVWVETLGGHTIWAWEGPLPSGSNRVLWNGRRSNGARAPAGRYRFFIEARDPAGNIGTANGVARLRR